MRTPFNSQNLECLFLDSEPMIAVMNKDYDLKNESDEIILDDLKDMPLIMYRRFEKILLSEFHKLDFAPNIFCINDDVRTTMLMGKSRTWNWDSSKICC